MDTILPEVFVIGTGPTFVYGIPQFIEPVRLTIESGSIKDSTSGVLGQGIGRIAGTVKEKGTTNTPVHRKVRLIRECDGLLMREVWSDPITGAYSFEYIDELQSWTVLAYDYNNVFCAAVSSKLKPMEII